MRWIKFSLSRTSSFHADRLYFIHILFIQFGWLLVDDEQKIFTFHFWFSTTLNPQPSNCRFNFVFQFRLFTMWTQYVNGLFEFGYKMVLPGLTSIDILHYIIFLSHIRMCTVLFLPSNNRAKLFSLILSIAILVLFAICRLLQLCMHFSERNNILDRSCHIICQRTEPLYSFRIFSLLMLQMYNALYCHPVVVRKEKTTKQQLIQRDHLYYLPKNYRKTNRHTTGIRIQTGKQLNYSLIRKF